MHSHINVLQDRSLLEIPNEDIILGWYFVGQQIVINEIIGFFILCVENYQDIVRVILPKD